MLTRCAVKILRSFTPLFYISKRATLRQQELRILTDVTDFHGWFALIRRIREYPRFLPLRPYVLRTICFIFCFGLILSSRPIFPGSVGTSAEKPGARLTQGHPGLNLPNLNEARRMNPGVPVITPPVSAPLVSKIGLSAMALPSMQLNNFPMAMIAHSNRVGTPGVDLLSRNFNWGTPIVSLPGRAGMDLNLGLSLNSLVWTKSGENIYFNLDQGFPATGFRLGLPELFYTDFHNTDTGTDSRIVIMPSGQRYEFRLNPAYSPDVVYEEMGSTYMLLTLKINPFNSLDKTWTLLLPDGAAYKFKLIASVPKCVEVKDRNGNFISVTYTSFAQIDNLIDTAGRAVKYNYDGSNRLVSITQNWSGVTHTYATFAYDNVTIQTNFSNLTMVGATYGSTVPVLSRVDVAGGKVYAFEYNTYAQVRTIKCYAPNSATPVNFPDDYTLLSYIEYDLPADAGGTQSDCPRFFSRVDWAVDWNDSVTISYDGDGATWGSAELPDGTVYKEFFGATGWQRGLTLKTETWSNDSRKKWTDSTWVNGNPSVSYWLNPQVIETNVRDEQGGWRKTTINYADFGAVSEIREYDTPSNPSTVLRRTEYAYLRGLAYTGNLKRRLTRLVTSQKVYDGDGALQSKVKLEYDLGGPFLVHPAPPEPLPIRYDVANFGPTFVQGRGNLNRITRWDINDEDDEAKSVASTMGYNTSGSMIFSRDPLGHETEMSYTDAFSDSVNRNTYAYPTSLKDADDKESKIKYNFDFGGVTWRRDPKGAAVANIYDQIGRLQKSTNEADGAYTRYVYAPNHLSVQTFTTVNDLSSEFYQVAFLDGHGRAIKEASEHPGSAGGYRGRKNEYDPMGRLVRQSNPAEIDADWELAGDDEEWEWGIQTYDWQARPMVSTNQDGTTKSISYDGCGCAGGQSVSTFDEMGRKQKAFYDVLGRLSKSQTFNWDGTTVYTTTINTYNARDQVTRVRAFKGAGPDPGDESCPAGLCQETVINYDGHGRMIFRKRPDEGGSGTVFTYYKDDMLHTSSDARGASATMSYNARHLTTNIAYSSPNESVIPNTPGVSFQYDANGNRTVMNDGAGTVTYGYDTQGLLTSETRQFSELVNNQFAHHGTGQPIQTSYEIGYSYNIGRQLKRITTPTGDTIDYTRDEAGRITGVSGTPRDGVTDYVSDIDYRAWGAEKRYAFGYQNYSITMSHNARMQVSQINDQDKLAADYTYAADGRPSAVQALNDRRLDRTFSYDHMGRVTGTRSASEAGLGSAQPAQLRQDYGYDEFNHMTLRQGKYWYTQNNTFSATYTNNLASDVMDKGQAQNWQYDAEGNVTSEGGKTHVFDAVGRRVKSTSTDTFCYDGDGRLVSQSYINPPPSTNPTGSNLTYYLWSTVLKENLAQIRLDGDAGNAPGSQKQYHREVFIYVNRQQVAVRKYDLGATGSQPNLSSLVEWNHRDPLDTIARSVGSSGGSTYSVDPLGTLAVAAFQNEINTFWSPPSGGPTTPPADFYRYSSANFSRTGISNPNAGSWGMGCALDGIQTSCGTVLGALRTGGLGNIVGAQLHGTPMTPEAISLFSTFTSASWRRVRTDERTIPGKSPNGLEFKEFPEANLPQERGHIEIVAVYEHVGAISGDPLFGGGGQDFPLPITRRQIEQVRREAEMKRNPNPNACVPQWKHLSGSNGLYNQVLKPLGLKWNWNEEKREEEITQFVPRSFAEFTKKLKEEGWQRFYLDFHKDHIGYDDYRKQYNGHWFHVSVDRPEITLEHGPMLLPELPPEKYTIHWEEATPGSIPHFFNKVHSVFSGTEMWVYSGLPPCK